MKTFAVLMLSAGMSLSANGVLAAGDDRFAGDGGVDWVAAAPIGSARPREPARPQPGWFNDRIFDWTALAPLGSEKPRQPARPDPGWFNDWGGFNWIYAVPAGSNKPMARVRPNLGGFIQR